MCNRPFVGMKMKSPKSYQSVWFGIIDIDQKEVTHCVQIDLQEQELRSIRSIKMAKNSIRDQNSEPSTFEEDILPPDCTKEYNYQVCIWFGDDKWIIKIFEYRVRWWKSIQHISDVTVDLYSQKFLIATMDPGVDHRISQMHIFPLFDYS